MKDRRCLQCDRPLPAHATSLRRFCSSRCRHRFWDAQNRPPEPVAVPSPPYVPETLRYCPTCKRDMDPTEFAPWDGVSPAYPCLTCNGKRRLSLVEAGEAD